jgi:hypothetical protein
MPTATKTETLRRGRQLIPALVLTMAISYREKIDLPDGAVEQNASASRGQRCDLTPEDFARLQTLGDPIRMGDDGQIIERGPAVVAIRDLDEKLETLHCEFLQALMRRHGGTPTVVWARVDEDGDHYGPAMQEAVAYLRSYVLPQLTAEAA